MSAEELNNEILKQYPYPDKLAQLIELGADIDAGALIWNS